MQKKLIALAVAGLMAAPAFAQSNVTIYGRIDTGYLSTSGDSGGVADNNGFVGMEPGLQGGSRIGFKGAEDLGNGLKAIFEMEFGSVNTDRNDGLGQSRHQWLGLTGNFGTVVAGRLDGVRYGIFNKYDAFGGGNVGNFTQMTAQVDRADNAIAYISPSFAGFTVLAAYSSHIGQSNPLGLALDENSENRGDARLNTLNLKYANGPISADLDWERVYITGANSEMKVTVTTLAGAYDFGVVRLSALYDILKLDNAAGQQAADVRTWFVSAKAPITSNVVLKATYGQTKDKEAAGDPKGKKFGIGADYLLSKRTNLYASYGQINNNSAAAFEISPYANSDGTGHGTRGFDIGVAHKF